MARGSNAVSISGNVGGEIVTGETKSGDPFFSFQVAIENKNKNVTWARVNVYGPLVSICRDRVKKSIYVVVKGELMNRAHTDEVEIRCEDIVFTPGGTHESRFERREHEQVGRG